MPGHLMDLLCNHDVLQNLTRETAEEKRKLFRLNASGTWKNGVKPKNIALMLPS